MPGSHKLPPNVIVENLVGLGIIVDTTERLNETSNMFELRHYR